MRQVSRGQAGKGVCSYPLQELPETPGQEARPSAQEGRGGGGRSEGGAPRRKRAEFWEGPERKQEDVGVRGPEAPSAHGEERPG